MNPTISIVNQSKIVASSILKRVVIPAMQKQFTRDFESAWGWGANLKFDAKRFDMKMIIR